MKIKEILTQNWAPKLTCVVLATALWYLIHQNVEKTPFRLDSRPPASQTSKALK